MNIPKLQSPLNTYGSEKTISVLPAKGTNTTRVLAH